MPGALPEVDLWRRAIVVPGARSFRSRWPRACSRAEALGPELADGPFDAAGLLAKQLAGDPDAAVAPLSDALDARRRDAATRGGLRSRRARRGCSSRSTRPSGC